MRNLLKSINPVYLLLSIFLFYAAESVASDTGSSNDYIIFIAKNTENDRNGYSGKLIKDKPAQNIGVIDSLCNHSSDKPKDASQFDRSYKAMIGSDYRYPISPAHKSSKSWVIQPKTKYSFYVGEAKYNEIGSTNIDQTFTFPLSSQLLNDDYRIWSGFNSDWSTTDNNCKNWTSDGGEKNGRVGRTDKADSNLISNEGKHCDGHGYLYCVMQPTVMMLNPTPGG